MFEAPASKIGVDHNECLTKEVNFMFPDDVNGKTLELMGLSMDIDMFTLRLGLALVENSQGWIDA